MADAWARMSGKVGVALVTGGPGHANAIGALYTAKCGEMPLVLLSGHAPLGERPQIVDAGDVLQMRAGCQIVFISVNASTRSRSS